MIIAITSVFIIVMSLFVYLYTRKAILQEGEEKQKKKYLLLTCFLGGIIGEGLLLLSYYAYGDTLFYSIKLLFAYELLLVAALIDYKLQIIPNQLILILLMGAVACFGIELFVFQMPAFVLLKEYGFGIIFGAGIFLLSMLFVKKGVGMGDIKLFGSLGMLLGFDGIFNLLFFSVLISAIYGITLLIRKKADKKVLLPLAPFAYISMAIIIILGV